MCRDVWVWASSDFPSMHLRWWQPCCKKNFKGGVKKIWHLRGPALMVLSLLCQTEEKIFISHYFVSTLEKRFCRGFFGFVLFFYNTEGQSFPWSSAWHFSVHLFVCIRIWMRACTTRSGRSRDVSKKNRNRNKKKKNAMRRDLSCRSVTVFRTYLLKSAIFPRGLELKPTWYRNHLSSDDKQIRSRCGALTFVHFPRALLVWTRQMICWANEIDWCGPECWM